MFSSGEIEFEKPLFVNQTGCVFEKFNSAQVVFDEIVVGGEGIYNRFWTAIFGTFKSNPVKIGIVKYCVAAPIETDLKYSKVGLRA
jgi:hypothetical protein